jgi:hypothetical protein
LNSEVKHIETTYSQLQLQKQVLSCPFMKTSFDFSLQVTTMRQELEARGLNSKGLKSQLIARLTKALRSEQEKEEEEAEKKEEVG